MKDKPIHISSIENNIQKLKKHLKKDGNIDALGEYGCTPLHYACREGNLEIVKFLLENGSNNNKTNRYSTIYPIFDAITSNNEKTLFSILKLLIDNGADVNNSDSFGNTLLHYAVDRENKDLIELLINAGCDINKTFRHDRDTPLHYACFQKNEKLISTLIQNGADRDIINIYNKTPESYL